MKNAAITQNVGVCTPNNAKIIKITELTHNTKLFEIQLEEEHSNKHFDYSPGQFVLITVFGVGEIPIGLTSSPAKRGSFELGIRKVGNVTNKIHQMKVGDIVGIRGPFGKGFPVEENKHKDLLYVCGGTGYFPIRSAFKDALDRREDYGKIMFLYGDRCPTDVLFPDENDDYLSKDDILFHQSVDRDDDKCWDGNVGVVTTLFPNIAKEIDPENTVVFVAGPAIMYKYVIIELEKLAIKSENIYLSLERKMKCGIGKCCHCGIGDKFACLDGPVFSLDQIRGLLEAL